jgi:hypothetical protein
VEPLRLTALQYAAEEIQRLVRRWPSR